MVFSNEAYLKAFPRKSAEPGTPAAAVHTETPKPGNVLEEVEKVETPSPAPEPETIDPEPEPGGGGDVGD